MDIELKKAKIRIKQLEKVLEFAQLELSNTGAGPNEWMGKLLKKINKVLEK